MKEKNITYYLIRERRLGKKENDRYYLFADGEWTADEKNVIMDRLMGCDPCEPEGSPYRFGNLSIMDQIDEITEEEAMKFINKDKE